MVTWLEVSVTSLQRTSLGMGGERAYLTHSHPYLPGSVVRGALAAAWLSTDGANEYFASVFERGRFGPALPRGLSVENQSVGRCKYHFDESHREFIDFAFESGFKQAKFTAPKCAARDWLKGDYFGGNLLTEIANGQQPGQNTAAEGKLFAREMLERGTVFHGYVVLPDIEPEALSKLRGIHQAFFGGRGSVLGRCEVNWEGLGDRAPGLVTDLDRGPLDQVVLRTLSPTILVAADGLPSSDFRGALRAELGAAGTVVEVWSDRMVSGLAGGWHNASGLPKPTEVAIAPGAVAVLQHVSVSALGRLLDRGLGLRRSEGYRWLEIVGAPWEPTRPKGPRISASLSEFVQRQEADVWLGELERLGLNADQTQWVSKQLHMIKANDESAVTRALEEAVGQTFVPPQLDSADDRFGLKKCLLEMPNSVRSSVASAMTRGLR